MNQTLIYNCSLHKRQREQRDQRTSKSLETVRRLELRSTPTQESGSDVCRLDGHVWSWNWQPREFIGLFFAVGGGGSVVVNTVYCRTLVRFIFMRSLQRSGKSIVADGAFWADTNMMGRCTGGVRGVMKPTPMNSRSYRTTTVLQMQINSPS